MILFCCTLWAGIFFFGASAVTYIVKFYFNEQVRVHHVQVMPNLDIKVGRIQFDFSSNQGGLGISGYARALNFQWSILTSKPSIDITVGPTQIDDYGGFENAIFSLFLDHWSEFSETEYKVEISSLNINEFILVETFDANGDLNLERSALSSSRARVKNVRTAEPDVLKVANILASLDSYNFKKTIAKQEFSFKIETDLLSSNLGQLTASGLEMDLNYGNDNNNIKSLYVT